MNLQSNKHDLYSHENASLELFLNTFHRPVLLIIFAG